MELDKGMDMENFEIGSRKHVRLTHMRDAFAQVKEIRESDFRLEEESVARVGLVQHHTADADDRPRDCGQQQQRDHVYFEPLAYFGFGEAARCFAICYSRRPRRRIRRGCAILN